MRRGTPRVGVGDEYGAVYAPSPPRADARPDPLAALETELRVSHETIHSMRSRMNALQADLDNRSAGLTEHTRARRALQAEVTEAQRFVAQTADELAGLRGEYERLENNTSEQLAQSAESLEASRAECHRLRAALDDAGSELAEQRAALRHGTATLETERRESERAHEAKAAARAAALESAFVNEREALIEGFERQLATLHEGWASQRARLEHELADAVARADDRDDRHARQLHQYREEAQHTESRLRTAHAASQEQWASERTRLEREADSAARSARDAEAMRAESEMVHADLVRTTEQLAQRTAELDAERAQRTRVEEWAARAHARLGHYERYARDAAAAAQLAHDSAADTVRAEALRAYEATAALAEANGRARTSDLFTLQRGLVAAEQPGASRTGSPLRDRRGSPPPPRPGSSSWYRHTRDRVLQ